MHVTGQSQDFSLEGMTEELDERAVFVFDGVDPDPMSITEVCFEIGRVIGAKSFGTHLLSSIGDVDVPTHVETIYLDEERMVKYFALGGILQATRGGETIIHDSRQVAKRLRAEVPELTNVGAVYGRELTYPGAQTKHKLFYQHPNFGEVLRYQGKIDGNLQVIGLPEGMTIDEYYRIVDETIAKTEPVFARTWKAGEVVVIHNQIALHSRKAFEGPRIALRARFDDFHNPTYPVRGNDS